MFMLFEDNGKCGSSRSLENLSLVPSGNEEPTWTYSPIPFIKKTVCLCCRRRIHISSFGPADNGLFTSKCSCGRTTTMYPADHPASKKLPMMSRVKAWTWKKSKPILKTAAIYSGLLYTGTTTVFWMIHNQCGVEKTWLETAGWLGQELWFAIA